jgi:hypothetical protein
MAVMIGVDPHKGSHTATAIDATETALGELRVRSGAGQVERLLVWAGSFAERTWAVEGASGLGYLLAQQLVAAGERVVDVQPKLAARVRLLATGATNKNDSNDARSVAIAAFALAGGQGGGGRRSHGGDEGVGQTPSRPEPAPHAVGVPAPRSVVRTGPGRHPRRDKRSSGRPTAG